jgi:hypothetical protein
VNVVFFLFSLVMAYCRLAIVTVKNGSPTCLVSDTEELLAATELNLL